MNNLTQQKQKILIADDSEMNRDLLVSILEDEYEIIQVKDLEIHLSEHKVTRNGQTVSLKPMEYDLLVLLAKTKNVAFTREQMLNEVWGSNYLGETRTIDVHIGQLRRKLDLSDVIKTIPKIGYRLEE